MWRKHVTEGQELLFIFSDEDSVINVKQSFWHFILLDHYLLL